MCLLFLERLLLAELILIILFVQFFCEIKVDLKSIEELGKKSHLINHLWSFGEININKDYFESE